MKKTIMIFGMVLIAQMSYSQFTPSNPHYLNDNAWLTGNFGIGTDVMPRKLNIYKSLSGAPSFPSPLESYTTGIRITHNWREVPILPYVEYQWDIGVTASKMYFTYMNTDTRIMTLTREGQVGIGTPAPDATLHVANINGVKLDAHFEGFTLVDGKEASLLLGRETGAAYGEWGIEYNNHAKGLNFWKPAGSNGFGNYFMFISDKGKVSIGLDPTVAGTFNGDYNLYVGKGILTEKVKVAIRSSSEWADYVFADDYQLMPLNEVEEYVNKNSHLPGVPSAEEVKEAGIDVAKMDAKLLEKIEELTLYIIDMEKQIKDLQDQVGNTKN